MASLRRFEALMILYESNPNDVLIGALLLKSSVWRVNALSKLPSDQMIQLLRHAKLYEVTPIPEAMVR